MRDHVRTLTVGMIVLFGLGAVAAVLAVHGSSDERAAIRAAVRAPFADLRDDDARALCMDFTPAAAAALMHGADCARRVQAMLARALGAAPREREEQLLASPRATVSDISWHGGNGQALLRRGAGVQAQRLRLTLLDGRWRLATPASLHLRADCASGLPAARACAGAVALRFG